MIYRTYLQTYNAVSDANKIFIASDSDEILEHCAGFTNNLIRTSTSCLTGTDRVAEAASKVIADIYFNIQGDEPILPSQSINTFLNSVLNNSTLHCSTAMIRIDKISDYISASIPKLVFSTNNRLLYSSRAPIPSSKNPSILPTNSYKHVCMYAFTSMSLKKFSLNSSKTPFEKTEDLEINRLLELNEEVKVIEVASAGKAVDTQADLDYVRSLLSRQRSNY